MPSADGAAATLNLKDQQVKFSGQDFTLRFAMRAMLACKDQWSIEEDRPLIKRLSQERVTDIPVLLWASLRTHHPTVTMEQCVDMCDTAAAEDLAVMKTAVTAAMRAGWGNPEEKKPEAMSPTKG